MRTLYITLLLLFTGIMANGQDFYHTWYGTLDIQGTKIRLVFHIEDNAGVPVTTMDSPDQGANDLPTSETIIIGDSIQIMAENLRMEYRGEMAPAGDRIEGTFSQNGFEFPLLLRLTEEEQVARPQDPDPENLDYYVEEVRFPNMEDSIVLAGTLTIPFDGEVKHTVILITGSGPQDRNEELPGINHRPFLVLSDYLTRNGIAVFRYDDRGVGDSGGEYSTATIEHFAKDAAAAINFINSRPDLAGSKIGLAGHSEGGMVAPMLADRVDFLILMGAPGTSIPQLLLQQSKLINKAAGTSDTIINLNEQIMSGIYAHMTENMDEPDTIMAKTIQDIFLEGLARFPENIKNTIPDMNEYAIRQTQGLLTPWFKHFISFVPYEYLSQVQKPVLAINGTLDLQVPYNENLAAIELGLKAAGNEDFELIALEGLNHLFQTAITGSPTEYAKMTETFNEEAMQTILEWINSH